MSLLILLIAAAIGISQPFDSTVFAREARLAPFDSTVFAREARLAQGGQPGQREELVERTLAIVGGQPITLGDVRAATALGLIDPIAADDRGPDVTARLIDRALILREVQRYAPPDPAEAAIEARLKAMSATRGAGFVQTLDVLGFSEARLRAWVRDDLRSQAYLAQRFAAVGSPTEQEIATAFTQQRAEFERAGQTFEQAIPIIRDRLTNARRRELISDWISDLRRRTDVIVLQ